MVNVPIVGKIAAGSPLLAVENIESVSYTHLCIITLIRRRNTADFICQKERVVLYDM